MAVSWPLGVLPWSFSSIWRVGRDDFCVLMLLLALVALVVGRGESGAVIFLLNNLHSLAGLLVRPPFPSSINPCLFLQFTPEIFWFFLCRRLVLISSLMESDADCSLSADVFFHIFCGAAGPIYTWDLAFRFLPFTSSLEARLAVSGRAWYWVWSLVVQQSPLRVFCPSQRVHIAGDAVSSSTSAPASRFVSGSLKMPRDCGGASLVATGLLPRRRQGASVSGGHAWLELRHARLRRFSSVSWRTARSPKASSAEHSACLHVPRKQFIVIFFFC